MIIHRTEYISASHHYRRGQRTDVHSFAEGNWLSKPARMCVEGFAFFSRGSLPSSLWMVAQHVLHFLQRVLYLSCSLLAAAATAEGDIFHRLSFCMWMFFIATLSTKKLLCTASQVGSERVRFRFGLIQTKKTGPDSRLGNFTTC